MPYDLALLTVLVPASIYDARSRTVPTVLIIAMLLVAGAAALAVHTRAAGALVAAPLAIVAWRSKEEALGWADVATIAAIGSVLGLYAGAVAVLVASTGALVYARVRGRRSVAWVPWLTVGTLAGLTFALAFQPPF